MSKKIIILLSVSIFLIASFFMITYFSNKQFYLNDESYQKKELIDLNIDELNTKIKNKESFALLVYQPACSVSSNFCNVIDEFQSNNNISFYQISFSSIKEDSNFDFLKFYPSFIIYRKGKVVDYLEANKDEDIKKYTNVEAFETWFTTYIKLK